MMRIFICWLVVFVFSCPCTWAEFLVRPDTNTLWLENGVNVVIGPPGPKENHWRDGLEFGEAPGGGLMLRGSGTRYSSGRYVPMDCGFPCLVMDVRQVIEGEGYHGLKMWMLVNNPRPLAMGIQVQPGLFVWRAFSVSPDIVKGGSAFLRIDLHNTELRTSGIMMVREPDYRIDMESAASGSNGVLKLGDEVTFRVRTPTPAEDVTLTFHANGHQSVLMNGQVRVQLHPLATNGLVWQATVKTESWAGYTTPAPEGVLPAGNLLIRAAILGRNLRTPVWTSSEMPVEVRRNARDRK